MKKLIKITQPIIVEGKYDKITLENVVDTLIIATNGFSIFKDTEKCALIRTLAQKDGVIVLTDSDSAGNLIRSHIKNIVGDGRIINVYVPQLKGKERRKDTHSKEGFLGVEGMSKAVILEALNKSGVFSKEVEENCRKITKTDMFLASLSGSENSSKNRVKFLKYLGLPQNLSPNAMLDILNTLLTFAEFEKAVEECLKCQDKS